MRIAVLVDEEIMVGGRRAWVREMEITEPDADERFGVGDSYTHSFVNLGDERHLARLLPPRARAGARRGEGPLQQ